MNFRRLGVLDVSALIVMGAVVFMPVQSVRVIGAFEHRAIGDGSRDVPVELALAADLQIRLHEVPADGLAAQELATIIGELGRNDMASRIAGSAASEEGVTSWRALAAVSSAYADRIVINNQRSSEGIVGDTLLWGDKALTACDKVGTTHCPAAERLRLQLYTDQLRRGMQAIAEGADPRFDPGGFRNHIGRTHTMIKGTSTTN